MDEPAYEPQFKPTRQQLRAITKLVKVLHIPNVEPASRQEAHNLIVELNNQIRLKYEEE